jgi:hypothetical protein
MTVAGHPRGGAPAFFHPPFSSIHPGAPPVVPFLSGGLRCCFPHERTDPARIEAQAGEGADDLARGGRSGGGALFCGQGDQVAHDAAAQGAEVVATFESADESAVAMAICRLDQQAGDVLEAFFAEADLR